MEQISSLLQFQIVLTLDCTVRCNPTIPSLKPRLEMRRGPRSPSLPAMGSSYIPFLLTTGSGRCSTRVCSLSPNPSDSLPNC